MAEPQVAPFGTWRSPISAALAASARVRFDELHVDGNDVYWVESRPAEGGGSVLVRCSSDGRSADLTPPGFSPRTRVHEYGGGAVAVSGGAVYFANFADQRVYRQDRGGAPRAITPSGRMRFADGKVDRAHGRLICVAEDHSAGGEPENLIAAVDLAGRAAPRAVARGYDFYAAPRLDPAGRRLAWLCWNHPNMPWDGCELWVARIAADGSLHEARRVAGGPAESVLQPTWSPDGELYFVSDRNGWWNLYRERLGQVAPVFEIEAELGAPPWRFGSSNYAFVGADRLVCAYARSGEWRLGVVDASTGALAPLDTPFTHFEYVTGHGDGVVAVAASPTQAPAVVRIDADGRLRSLSAAPKNEVDPAYFSPARAIEFPTSGGRTAHAFFYPPRNPMFRAPAHARPPLIVKSHGGPTGAAESTLSLGLQFWTSRGFAVADVNYGGSTGYGRPYRERLNGQWGVVDVDDCANVARRLAALGEVDPARLIITGSSAGGYTTLCALAFRDVFRAGASYYGISDAESLTHETHKFESRYLDLLIGPYPRSAGLYRQRSAIHHAEGLDAPVIFFQGLEDEVVPPDQAERMVSALRAKGVPVAYLAFEGEQHGFRKAENMQLALRAELYFYARVFGFEPDGEPPPIQIHNL